MDSEEKVKKNWKTTVCGIVGGIVLLGQQVLAYLDGDPTTEVSVATIITALGMLGLGWFARDKDVSSKASRVED